jgi:uncharacterized protein (TIGR02453 family)
MKTKARPPATGERFVGWPKPALQFFAGLQKDNSKTYFETHRTTFEEDIRGPMEGLLAELRRDFGSGWESKIFRLNRDLRFSPDKRPYKEHIGAMYMSASKATGFYVQVSADGLYAVNGTHEMMSDQLTRYRDAVAGKDGEKLSRIVETLIKAGYNISDPSLKRVPPGHPNDHPRSELLRRTGLMAGRSWRPGAWLQSKEALERVRQLLKDTKTLTSWLETRVGPSKTPSGQRR